MSLYQAASSHVKRLVGERGDWEVEVERLRFIFSHRKGGVLFWGLIDQFYLNREQHKTRSRELRDQCK